jgi:hypothetical protein
MQGVGSSTLEDAKLMAPENAFVLFQEVAKSWDPVRESPYPAEAVMFQENDRCA